MILVQHEIISFDYHPQARPNIVAGDIHFSKASKELHLLVDAEQQPISRADVMACDGAPDRAKIVFGAFGDNELDQLSHGAMN